MDTPNTVQEEDIETLMREERETLPNVPDGIYIQLSHLEGHAGRGNYQINHHNKTIGVTIKKNMVSL